jgi:hypothetical protein
MCWEACLREENIKMMVECIRLDRDCADAGMRPGTARVCAEACRKCAEECRNMASSLTA